MTDETTTVSITTSDGQTTGPVPMDALLGASAVVVDDLILPACELVVKEQKCSTTFVQRHLAIGYNRAVRLVEHLEALGVVTAANEVGKREVVVHHVPPRLTQAAAAKAKGATPMKETAEDEAVRDNAYRVTADELRQFIERFERLEAEKKDIAEQQKDVMAEAKARGYDTKVMRKVIALRKREPDDVAEEEAVLEMYKEALGMS